MKKHHKQSGFAAIELVLILIIVTLVGFVGWTVYNNRAKSSGTTDTSQTTNNTTQDEVDKKTAGATSLPDGYSLYENKGRGISIGYPSNWSVDKVTAPVGTDSFALLASPDYKTETISSFGGDVVGKGVLVSLNTIQPRGQDVQSDYKDPKFASDVTNITLGGEKAVRYYLAYEGAVYSHAVTYKNGLEYDIFMQYPQAEGDSLAATRQKYEPTFLKMLATVTFN